MEATEEMLAILLSMQDADRRRFTAMLEKKQVPGLDKISEIRSKITEIQSTYQKLSNLLSQTKQSIIRFTEEDSDLRLKAAQTERKIQEAKGDYRAVSSLTRDLEGIHKRRETLEEKLLELEGTCDEIQGMITKAQDALTKNLGQEKALSDAYQAKLHDIDEQIDAAMRERNDLSQRLPVEIADAYDQAVRECGGIGISVLSQEKCSACRNTFDHNRLLKVQRESPLSKCPYCKRLLIVRIS